MKKIISIFILTIFTLTFGQSVLAISQVTEPIIIKDILRNSEVIDTLVLFNSEDKKISYKLKGEGEIAGWINFYEIDDINLENPITEVQLNAQSRLDAIVKFKIPFSSCLNDIKVLLDLGFSEDTARFAILIYIEKILLYQFFI